MHGFKADKPLKCIGETLMNIMKHCLIRHCLPCDRLSVFTFNHTSDVNMSRVDAMCFVALYHPSYM